MDKLTKEQFVLKAIEALHNEESKGIHVVWSGFNAAFEKYFGEKSRATTDAMQAAGLIDVIPFKEGAFLYKKGEAPDRIQETINKIVGK